MRRDIVEAVNVELLQRGLPKLTETTPMQDLVAIMIFALLRQDVRVEPKEKAQSKK